MSSILSYTTTQLDSSSKELTVADLFHLPYVTIATDIAGVTALTSDKTPNVARSVHTVLRRADDHFSDEMLYCRWWKDVSSRQSWKDVQAEAKA